MKIKDITAIYPKYPQPLAGWRHSLWQIVVRIEMDTGLVGWGFGGGGEAACVIVNGHFRELLLGQEVNNTGEIAKIWESLYHASIPYGRKGIAIMALSGIDLALWDVVGKAENVPIYEMLGGLRHPDVVAYATGVDSQWYVDLGFKAHKLPHRWDPAQAAEPQYEALTQQIEGARSQFGEEGTLMVDCYMSWNADVTLEMAKRLGPHDILWFEDVTTPDQLTQQSTLRNQVKPILIAGGEHEFTEHGFQAIAKTKALDIWQPDITWCGGMTSMLRIIELARQAETIVVPHRGGEIWCLHLIGAGKCAALAEVLPGSREASYPALWIDEPFPQNGVVTPNDAPGFGVSPNPALI